VFHDGAAVRRPVPRARASFKFNLVVMDEASQLKPEDAIGALARGGQIVIVGDPKQLSAHELLSARLCRSRG